MLTATAPMNIPTQDVPLVDTDVLRTTKPTVLSSSPGRVVAEVNGISLDAIGKAEARKIMSEEHRILGFRPPQGSLAAEAQAAAAKHPDGNPDAQRPDPLKLKALAKEDAERILIERKMNEDSGNGAAKQLSETAVKPVKRASPPPAGVNLSTISEAEARTLMSHEHRALGFRPPPGSLAAEAQAAAAKHPEGAGSSLDEELLKEVALKDAERIKADREVNIVGEVNVSTLGKDGAATIVSAAEAEVGASPKTPEGSLLAEAQKAAVAYPEGGSFPVMDGDKERLEEVGKREAEKLEEGESTQANASLAPAELMAKEANGEVPRSVVSKGLSLNPASVGSILRSGGNMFRTDTNESVQIIGDVVG